LYNVLDESLKGIPTGSRFILGVAQNPGLMRLPQVTVGFELGRKSTYEIGKLNELVELRSLRREAPV
jgi:hypothetical protein